jgi:hypothetical protein
MSGNRYFRVAVIGMAILFVVVPAQARALAEDSKTQSGAYGNAGKDSLLKPRIDSNVITIGGSGADIPGYTSETIQIAVDALKSRGGGTIKLCEGVFAVTAPVRLASGICLTGDVNETILRKVDGFHSAMALDCGYGELKVAVKDASGFKVGMGVIIQDADSTGGWDVTTAKITAIDANWLFIDNYTVRDYQSDRKGIVSNACSLVEAVQCEDVRIANLTIVGNKGTNDFLGGCRGGGIYLHKAGRCVVEQVRVRGFNGDGISWQITEDITVRGCDVSECSNFGFHPGTGSVRTRMADCVSQGNGTDGIFVCWRVQNSSFTGNRSCGNGRYGISIGHKDTDNIFENNHIYGNGEDGIYFRDEIEQNGAHRNTFRRNVVENNGTKAGGYGFNVDGVTTDILIERNTIRDTGSGSQKAGVFIGKKASRISTIDNEMSGHEKGDIVDMSAE